MVQIPCCDSYFHNFKNKQFMIRADNVDPFGDVHWIRTGSVLWSGMIIHPVFYKRDHLGPDHSFSLWELECQDLSESVKSIQKAANLCSACNIFMCWLFRKWDILWEIIPSVLCLYTPIFQLNPQMFEFIWSTRYCTFIFLFDLSI